MTMQINEKIKSIRIERKLTAREAAKLVGMTEQAYGRFENHGAYNKDTIERICNGLDLDLTVLQKEIKE